MLRPLAAAQQVRDAGAVDVGIHQADLAAGPTQPAGEIRGDRALADAALARSNRYHRLGSQSDLAQLLRFALMNGQFHGHVQAGEPPAGGVRPTRPGSAPTTGPTRWSVPT